MADTEKGKPKIPRQDMPVQDEHERRANFSEVALGYSPETAKLEANRCIQCKKPKCVEGCPVGVLIPQFIKALREGDMVEAVKAMKTKNNLP
ncbi:MAG: dihydropyrimidine dehydrogenase, partial [bacterium]